MFCVVALLSSADVSFSDVRSWLISAKIADLWSLVSCPLATAWSIRLCKLLWPVFWPRQSVLFSELSVFDAVWTLGLPLNCVPVCGSPAAEADPPMAMLPTPSTPAEPRDISNFFMLYTFRFIAVVLCGDHECSRGPEANDTQFAIVAVAYS